jgi:DNA-binding CsgD family transcriptional regulator/tetratricopeptide (TPR) repeat protein
VRGSEQQRWHALIEKEMNNLREALAWTTDGRTGVQDANLGLQIAGALWYFWFRHGLLSEGRRWLTLALAVASDRGLIYARALLGAGALAWQQGDYEIAAAQLDASLAIWRTLSDRSGLAETIHLLGHIHFDQRDYASARRLFTESHHLFIEIGEHTGIVPLLGDLGMVAYHTADYDAAQELFMQSLELARQHQFLDRVAEALIRLGDLARLKDDLGRATMLYKEGLDRWRDLHSTLGVASALHKLGQTYRLQGETANAQVLFLESLAHQRELDNKQGIAECLAGIGGIAADKDTAVRLLAASATLLESIGAPLAPVDQKVFEADTFALRTQLTEMEWAAAWEKGCLISLEESVALAHASQPADLSLAISPPSAPSKQLFPLSPREQEVAALVAHGLSNREIATALTITGKTAANHIEHIMNKLDLRSRTQIAVWAIEHGIAPSSSE